MIPTALIILGSIICGLYLIFADVKKAFINEDNRE